MLFPALFLLILFFLFCTVLVLERKIHSRALQKIPVRIHVNGTRGKSSVTRLIHSILIEARWNVYGKTTGSVPSLLYPDRSTKTIFRNQISILEQSRFLKLAFKQKADAIVMECMAVQPQYQKDSEDLLIQATHVVITNIRPDHEEWGDYKNWTESAFAQTVPQNGVVVCGTSLIGSSLEKIAKERNTTFLFAEPKTNRNQILSYLQSMRYPEHLENLEIAIRVCESLGISEEWIRNGILKVEPDPGALHIQDRKWNQISQTFVFAFSANDVFSWRNILQSIRQKYPSVPVTIVFNSRRERPIRTLEFAKFFSELRNISKIYFFGPWWKLFQFAYTGNAEMCDPTQKQKDPTSYFYDSQIWIGAGNFQGEGRIWMEGLAASIETKENRWKS
ncbi:poly-gamma-glutamate synthase PgsB [Leptospira sp. WS92.C1]